MCFQSPVTWLFLPLWVLEGYCFCPGWLDAAYPFILHKRLLWTHRWIAHCKYSQCVSCKMYLIYCRWSECMQCLSHFGFALHRASNLHKCRNVNASGAYQTRNTCSGLMKPEHWSPVLKLDVCKCLERYCLHYNIKKQTWFTVNSASCV